MKNVLVIESSPRGSASASRKASAKILEEIRKTHPKVEVIHRDLAVAPLPHLSPETVVAFFTPQEKLSLDQKKLMAASNQACEELIKADAILISAPMWNFSTPSSLKAWVDHVVRSGLTFSYTDKGPIGLLNPSKKVFLALSSGGVYSAGPTQAFDHLSTYLSDLFSFLGLKDIQIIRAEGTAYPDNEGNAIKAAIQTAQSLRY